MNLRVVHLLLVIPFVRKFGLAISLVPRTELDTISEPKSPDVYEDADEPQETEPVAPEVLV